MASLKKALLYFLLSPILLIATLFRFALLNTFFQRGLLYFTAISLVFKAYYCEPWDDPYDVFTPTTIPYYRVWVYTYIALFIPTMWVEWGGSINRHGLNWLKYLTRFVPPNAFAEGSVDEHCLNGPPLTPIKDLPSDDGLQNFVHEVLQKDKLPEGWETKGLTGRDFNYLTQDYISMYACDGEDHLAEKNPPGKWLFDEIVSNHLLFTKEWRTKRASGWQQMNERIDKLPQGTEEEVALRENLREQLKVVKSVMMDDDCDMSVFFYLLEKFHEDLVHGERIRNIWVFSPPHPSSTDLAASLAAKTAKFSQGEGIKESAEWALEWAKSLISPPEDPNSEFEPLLWFSGTPENKNLTEGLDLISFPPFSYFLLPFALFSAVVIFFLVRCFCKNVCLAERFPTYFSQHNFKLAHVILLLSYFSKILFVSFAYLTIFLKRQQTKKK